MLVLVDGELWNDESVFWQNKLQDRGVYEVVYCMFPQFLYTSDKGTDRRFLIGKPWFFQYRQIRQDCERGVLWDSEVPLATTSSNEPPKVKLVYGPSRVPAEEHLPAEYGTNWGPLDPRDGKSLRELRLQMEEAGPPPPYCEN